MLELHTTYGKTIHTWAYDLYPDLPLGPPNLMMAYTADGQADEAMVADRDDRHGLSTKDKREHRRGYLPGYECDAGADQWTGSGKAAVFKKEDTPIKMRGMPRGMPRGNHKAGEQTVVVVAKYSSYRTNASKAGRYTPTPRPRPLHLQMLRLAAARPRPSSLKFRHMAPPARNLASSAPRRSDADAVPPGYAADPNAPPMLRFEASLPRLPVPTLASTASKYLETVKPILTPTAFSKTQAAVDEFVASDLARELQRRLEARATTEGRDSWLAEWWDSAAYNAYRDPVVVFVSYFYVHLDDPRMRGLPAKRAALLLKAMTAFRTMVEGGSLSPERVKQIPLAMSSYKWMFHSSRYPVKPEDSAKKFDPTTHNHVAVLRKNKFFILPLSHAGVDLSAAELEAQLEKIINLAGEQKGPAVGALSSENRDIWADARAALLAAGQENAGLLEQVESAAVVLCLDDTKPVTREQISWGMWTGDGRNRFYDKHQFVVYENGRSGFLGEHSCMDGTPTLRLNQFILASLAAGRIDLGTATVRSDLPAPTELKFTLDDTIKKYIAEAEAHFDELIGKHDLRVLHYEGYGKNAIKKYKASPDAWVQLVKQLAYQKMYGRPAVTYESAQTRKYKLGRTEVIRSASNESKAWAEAMVDPDRTDTERAALFRKAVTRHIQYSTWAADGQGVDRHLFGLKRMLKEGEPLPQIYKDEAFAKTSHWELSTSQLSSPFIDGWGYGEVVPDGYGLSYAIGDDHIRWTITSMNSNVEELRHYLAEAATETRQMMERAAQEEQTKGQAKL